MTKNTVYLVTKIENDEDPVFHILDEDEVQEYFEEMEEMDIASIITDRGFLKMEIYFHKVYYIIQKGAEPA